MAFTLACSLVLIELRRTCDVAKEPLTEIPSEYLPAVAGLTQESDRPLPDLARMIWARVFPNGNAQVSQSTIESQDSQTAATVVVDALPVSSIEQAILKVADRVNYGLSPSDVASSSTATSTYDEIPAPLQIWRWEVHDKNLLQPERVGEMLARREERQLIREGALQLFSDLSQDEREALLTAKKRGGGSKASKAAAATATATSAAEPSATVSAGQSIKDTTSTPGSPSKPVSEAGSKADSGVIVIDDDDDDDDDDVGESSSKPRGGTSSPEASRKASSSQSKTPKAPRKKKVETLNPEQQAEKDRKEAERAEKKRLKDAKEAKKLKETEALAKSSRMMGMFVTKAASPPPQQAGPQMSPTRQQGSPTLPTQVVSDFERTFQPAIRKNQLLAPVNRFARDVDRGDIDDAMEAQAELDIKDLLAQAKGSIKTATRKPLSRKGIRPPVVVRETMRLIAESDLMTGLNAEAKARRGIERLKRDRKAVPIKYLFFATDLRPPYCGTWTRPSNLISGRRPLCQDPVALDYNYDSEAEWVDGEDDKGEEIDGDNEDDADDAKSNSDADSEMDDWLVDDLEEEGMDLDGDGDDIIEVDPMGNPLSPVLDRKAGSKQTSPSLPSSSGNFGVPMKPKRSLPLPNAGKRLKKKKKVVKSARRFKGTLVSVSIGPLWQTTLGEASHPTFEGYQMEFLNDAYPGLDPFTFVAGDVPELISSAVMPAEDKRSSSTLFHPSSSTNKSTTAVPTAAAASTDSPRKLLPTNHGLGLGLMNTPSAEASASIGPSSSNAATTTKAGPFVPAEYLSEVLNLIEGSTDNKILLTERLALHFKAIRAVTKGALTKTLTETADRQGKKDGSVWKVKAEWRSYLSSS